jgi:hypothetical protein
MEPSSAIHAEVVEGRNPNNDPPEHTLVTRIGTQAFAAACNREPTGAGSALA